MDKEKPKIYSETHSEILELRVFVYGTLKPGGRYHQPCCGDALTAAIPAVVKGELYDFARRGYPAMTAGDDWVKGYLLIFEQSAEICAEVLRRLDRLEGYRAERSEAENEYLRRWVEIFTPDYQPLGQSWVYVMRREQALLQGGHYLASGVWPNSENISG